jgi:hypothetical protein
MKHIFAILFLSVAAHGYAQEWTIPPAFQASLVEKALPFDRDISRNSQGDFKIAIVYQSKFRESFLYFNEFSKSIEDSSDEIVKGYKTRIIPIDLSTNDALNSLKKMKVSVISVAPLRGFDVAQIAQIAKDMKASTISCVEDDLKQGIAMSFRLQGGKPKILVNLLSSRNQGADYDSKFLKLVILIQ